MSDYKYPEFFKAFRFLVEVESTTGSGSGSVIVAAFSRFSGIKMRVDVLNVRSGNETRGTPAKQPGLTQFENVSFSKGVIGDNAFLDWILSTAPSENDRPTATNMRRTVYVTAIDDKGRRGVVWTLKNALPVGYTLEPFDASTSDVMHEGLELAIEGFSRKTNDPATAPAVNDKL